MAPSDSDLKVESRLTRLETTIDTIAEEVRNTSKQIRETNETVDRLATLATGDRRLVKGFVLALGIMWGAAQFAIPLLKDDGSNEVVKILREMQTAEKRLKAMEDWAGSHVPAMPVPVAPSR